jgi:hypothetical protein
MKGGDRMRYLLAITVTVIAMLAAAVPTQAQPEVPAAASLCGQLFGEHGASAHGNSGSAVSGTAVAGLCKGGQ